MARSAKAMGNVLFGGIVNTIIFTFATAVYLRIAASLVDDGAGMDLPLRLALLLILTVALWVLTRPWRRLTGLGRDLTHVIDRAGYRISGEGIRDSAAAAARGAATVGNVASGAGAVMSAITLAEMVDGQEAAAARAAAPGAPPAQPGIVYVQSTRESPPGAVPAALPSNAPDPAGPAGVPLVEYRSDHGDGARAAEWAEVRSADGSIRPAVTTITADGSEVYAIYSANDHSMHSRPIADEPDGRPAGPPPPDGTGEPPVYRRGSGA
jgi:hypothetical protein